MLEAWISAKLDALLETGGALLAQTPDFIRCGDTYIGESVSTFGDIAYDRTGSGYCK